MVEYGKSHPLPRQRVGAGRNEKVNFGALVLQRRKFQNLVKTLQETVQPRIILHASGLDAVRGRNRIGGEANFRLPDAGREGKGELFRLPFLAGREGSGHSEQAE